MTNHYIAGYSIGSKGLEPPADLNKVRASASLEDRTLQLVQEKGIFRTGYIDGLYKFILDKRIELEYFLERIDLSVINSDIGLEAFLKGIRLEAPDTIRDSLNPRKISKTGIIETMRLHGYALGFVIGIAREYGVAINPAEAPVDNKSYEALVEGLKGIERELYHAPQEPQQKWPFQLFKGAGKHYIEIPLSLNLDEAAYLTGLRVFAHISGFPGLDAKEIRNPNALADFKAKLKAG